MTRRIIGSIVGTVIISMGISIFKEAMLGIDAISGLNMRIAALLGLRLGVMNLITNSVFFLLQFLFGRRYIGLGTVVNGVGCGFIIEFFYEGFIVSFFGVLDSMPLRLLFVLLGVLVISVGVSIYQTADLGVAPYDYLSIGLRDHTPLPYFWCRMGTDCSCALLGFLLGGCGVGLVGLGTVVCSLGLGPFIQFFNRVLSERLLRYQAAWE